MSTSHKGITVPEYADAADGPAAFRSMVDSGPIPRFTTAGDRDVAIPAPIAGLLTYITSTDQFTRYDGSAWQNFGSGYALVGHVHIASDITDGVLADARLPVSSVSAPGIVQLSTSVTSTSQTVAATASAVKSAYDRAANYLPLAGGTVTGEAIFAGSARRTGTANWAQGGFKNVTITDDMSNVTGGVEGDVVIIYNAGGDTGLYIRSDYGGTNGWHKVAAL